MVVLSVGLFGVITRYKNYATLGILIAVMWVEFPLLYIVYGKVILVYFALSIFGSVIFLPRKYRLLFSVFSITWDVMVIVFDYFYPIFMVYEERSNMLIFTICSYLIVSIAILVILSAVLGLYEQQKKKLFEMNEQLYFVATHDPLTKLYNRKYLMNEIEERVKKTNACFIVVLVDIDNFKRINDTYGHSFGDEVLMKLAQIMEKEMLGKGFAARYGGEEFMMIFDEYNQQEALKILKSVSIQFMEYFQKEKNITVTFSGGLEIYNVKRIIDEVIKGADNKLYEAKQKGKNQIIY